MKQTAYLIIENRKRPGSSIPRFAIVGVRQTKPAMNKDQIAVKINVELPDGTFETFIPEVNMTVPDELLVRGGDIEVEAVAPDDEP